MQLMSNAETFKHTLVIGFTQTRQWYEAGGAFAARGDSWALLWANGGGVDRWREPDFEGWTESPVTADASSGYEPDRVLLTISGPYGDDRAGWAAAIGETIVAIRAKYASVRQIVLQPIVGGPANAPCPNPGGSGNVRASSLHPIIDEAIAMVAGGDVVAGYSPEVRSCGDYANATGHLTPEGAAAVGRAIAAYYGADLE